MVQVLNKITKATGYKFVYSNALKEIETPISINCSNASIKNVLDILFKDKQVSYKIEGKNIALTPNNIAPSKSKNSANIEGLITDEQGEPLIGVAVKNMRTTKIVASNLDGKYSIEAINGDVILFTSIGMANKEITFNGKSQKLNIVMSTDLIALEDVVVTGYQTLSKERSTGSYAVITQEKINTKMQPNIIERLEGMVAGLNTNRGKIEVRGVTTLNSAYASPLYVVDGVPFEGEPGLNSSILDVINPADIVNVTVLKDATAASIYGARSANGVIVITTRSGQVGKTKVNYSGSVNFQGLPDRDYLNRMSSNELVDYMIMVNNSHKGLSRTKSNQWQHDIQSLILDLRENKITNDQFNSSLVPYRENDRYSQVVNEFLRKRRVTQQHNLAFSGGADIYKYMISVNYTGTSPYERAQQENRLGFNLRNTFNFYKWLQVDAGIMGSNVSSDYDNGILGINYLNSGPSSFFMLRDQAGDPMQMYAIGSPYKSQLEINRLKSIGLQDETYIPVNELGNKRYSAKSNYLNINIGAKFKIIDGLSASLRFQTERTTGHTKQYNSKYAYEMKRMINDATQTNTLGVHTFNIPLGGSILQKNMDNTSYTVRAQVDFNRNIDKNNTIQALAGAEVRKVVTNGNGFYRLGYDDNNLGYTEFNALGLTQMLSGTQAVNGTYTFTNLTPAITMTDNRYVSFYANASWNFKEKLSVTGSIRIDQSNLFGTDPKYQYRPLWSAGANYLLLKNYNNWLDRLSVRATYGISGNIPKMNGPYLIAKLGRNNYYTNEPSMYIDSPPNNQLRWEKTNVFNVGIDFNMFNNRFNGSIEYYNKNTTDLLGPFSIDPTLGWDSVNMNFGSMYNRGFEITLSSVNISKQDFRWNSNLTFSYNKNKITRIESSSESASSYFSGLNNRKDYPMGSLFSIRYKGLDENGFPVALDKDGNEVKDYNKLTKNDLVFSGTYNPPYNAALTNTLTYKGIELEFMFVYSGGHVMRDIASGYLITSHPIYTTGNGDRNLMNYWKKPGDELLPDINPAYMFGSKYRTGTENIWRAADKHIKRGDYIKLRDLTLSYNLPSSLLSRTFINGVRVSFQARNLWYWAANGNGLDPEVWEGYSSSSSNAPKRGTHMPAEFTFGLNLNF